jgi:hypothetical protein
MHHFRAICRPSQMENTIAKRVARKLDFFGR